MTGQIFSIWNWPAGRYSYFLASAAPASQAKATTKALSLGKAPDDVLPVLPIDARFMGWGEVAIGTMARLPGGAA